MLRKHRQLVASFVWAGDMAVVLGSFALAYYIRFFWQDLVPVRFGVSPREETRVLVVAIAVIWTAVFRLAGLYRPGRPARFMAETMALVRATALAVLCLVGLFYFFRDVRYSRLTIGLFALLSTANLAIYRAALRRLLRIAHKSGRIRRRALVVGAGDAARALVERLDGDPALGVNVVGLLASDPERAPARVAGKPVLGSYEAVERVAAEHDVDEVYLALPLDQQQRLVEILHRLSDTTVDIRLVPDVMQYVTLRGGVEELDGLPVVHLQSGPAAGWDAVAKRAFDLVFASLALIVAAPIMLVAALLVKLTSPGPIFYVQERAGLDGRVFKMLKFRSMRVDAEAQTGAVWARADDDRTTWVGRWMRRLSIDELPQLFNVLKGDMSLVGPRPERPVFIERFKREIPRYNLRHKAKAGITGLAHAAGWRGRTSLEKRIERDLYYIEHWSLWLDFKILVRTVLGGFLSRNAY